MPQTGNMASRRPLDRISSSRRFDLASNGFTVIKDFLDEQTVVRLIGAVESMSNDSTATRIRRGVSFARRNLLDLGFVRDLAADGRVQGIVQSLAPGSVPVRAILFDKTGSANWIVPWHQDRSIAVRTRIEIAGFGPWSFKAGVAHVQPPTEILQQMLTLRFHLDPCGNDNGPLRVIGGTHRCILDQSEVESAVATGAQTVWVTASGGLLVMRPLLLHASSPATAPSHRRVIHIEFGPSSLPGGLHWAHSNSGPGNAAAV
jgi:ectoine hydroxylase-related dioxygenase (phytanoyl-CoA dioxygenase family)